ncbi:YDG domain-containing protein [Rickettsiella endosymbiont of Dermanyssus gallinae]|uniref:YDG domain-containing protein n=1 Tax=Rickettsiella endosymbiont of Dermanyssus gallinae TaxID=2856608 RepID=UPI001C52A57F|nr:YDG domain-containing protein [Rickettsiella endosymbiont of Dermanyssus gallinae]
MTIIQPSLSGTDAGKYLLVRTSLSNAVASITPLGIDVAAMGRDKVYDSTPAAQVTLASDSVLPGDKVNLMADTANFVDKHAGTNKAVKVGDIRVEGTDKGNYQINNPKVSTVATIVPLHVNVIATAADKAYDGTPAAQVRLISNEVLPGDSIYFSGIGSFEDKNIGTNKLVNVTDIHVGGADSHTMRQESIVKAMRSRRARDRRALTGEAGNASRRKVICGRHGHELRRSECVPDAGRIAA